MKREKVNNSEPSMSTSNSTLPDDGVTSPKRSRSEHRGWGKLQRETHALLKEQLTDEADAEVCEHCGMTPGAKAPTFDYVLPAFVRKQGRQYVGRLPA